jgi:hypothetical protein
MVHTPTSQVHCPGCGCLSPLFVVGKVSRAVEAWMYRHEVGDHSCDGCEHCKADTPAPAGDVITAEAAFLDASIAVWREIDRLDSRPGGYAPTDMDVKLREAERAAWERYRALLDTPAPPSPGFHRHEDDLDPVDSPVAEQVMHGGYIRPARCICTFFRDTGGFRLADLTCPRHGASGDDPGDGYWERDDTPAPATGEQPLRDPIGRDEMGNVCQACLHDGGPCICVIDCGEQVCTGWTDEPAPATGEPQESTND